MAKTPEERRVAHAAYMREYMKRPEQKAKAKIRKQEQYRRDSDQIKAKTKANALARYEAAPLAACACGCGEMIKSLGKNGRPVYFVFGHRHRLPVAHPTGADHPNWKGEHSLSGTIHDWINRWHEKTGVCEACGVESRTHFAFNHRLGKHTRNREDYRELCAKCHNLWDIEMGVQKDVGTLRRKS